MLRIAAPQLNASQQEYLRHCLASGQIEFSITDTDESALQRGEVDTIVSDLALAPTALPQQLVWAAIVPRQAQHTLLYIASEKAQASLDFRLPLHGKVLVPSLAQQVQLADYRPDLSIIWSAEPATAQLAQLQQGHCDAVLLWQSGAVASETPPNVQVIQLQTAEIVPPVSQGFLAFMTLRDDLPTRRLLRDVHHSVAGHCSNVERGVLQLAQACDWLPTLSVHCSCDQAGNYHAWATAQVGENLRRVQMSNSTFLGISERIFARLNQPD
jgi:porphobilinogen deaminase